MRTFDAAILQAREQSFLRSPADDHKLEVYYLAMVDAGEILLRSHLRDIGLLMDAERRAEVVHDAFTRLLEFHRRHPGQEVPAAARMFQEIRYQLHNRTAQRRNAREGSSEILDTMAALEQSVASETEAGSPIREIVNDSTVDGRRIVVEIFSARQLKRAFRRIATFTPKPWIYEHAADLRLIFQMTRGRE